MHVIIRALRRLRREERGITLLLTLFVLTVTTFAVAGTYVAVVGDSQLSRNDLDQQRAYSAAQAGIAAYTYQLNQDANYWEQCNSLPSNAASGGQSAVPNSTDGGSTEYYSVTPLVASTSTSSTCDPTNALATMIEGPSLASGAANPAGGTFRISSTGTSNNVSRTIVAQYKRQSFLNFVYYTDYETLDPVTLYNPNSNPTEPTDCARHYPNRGSDCAGPIDFLSGDQINGPLHSEDTLAICGTSSSGPSFGRSGSYDDAIEAAGVSTESGFSGQSNCVLKYTVNPGGNSINTHASSLTPPPTNAQLLQIAQQDGYVFTGVTHIKLSGTNMTVTNANLSGGAETVAFPDNGVVYVKTATSGCSTVYTPYTANSAYTADATPATATCGNVYVSGSYTSSLTIASDNDVIIDGNITTTGYPGTPTGTQLLGLIANDFVRIYHPVGTRSISDCNNANNSSGTIDGNSYPLSNIYIYAAILAVNHSFIVDNYDCGSPLGTLHVEGAIAQLFRGTVGTFSNGSINSGYLKDYVYNDELADIEPPYFLNPVSAAWTVQRLTECDAASC